MASINPSLAADMAFKAPWAPGFSWSGCYIGAQGGGGFMKDSMTGSVGLDSEGIGGLSTSDSSYYGDPIFHAGGGTVGGQLGCNYQWGQAVLGVEGEGWWSSLTDRYTDNSTTTVFDPGSSFTQTFAYTDQSTLTNRWNMAISLRAGWAFDRVLLYAKAGAVWGKFNFSASASEVESYSDTGIYRSEMYTATSSQVLPGMLLGWGIEYAITNNWIARVEADYVNFNISNVNYAANYICTIGSCGGGPGSGYTQSGILSGWAAEALLKVGLNYKW